MRRRSSFFLLLPVMVVWGCGGQPATDTAANAAEPAESVADVTKAIEEANTRFVDAMQRGDVTVAAANYADDAVVMMPNAPAWQGHAALVEGLTGFLAEYKLSNAKPLTSNVMLAGDLAIETGTFEWTMQPKSGAAVTDKGKYLTVWKKQADGSWKIVRDINNSDLPPAH